jgi:hypothetical protein
MPSETYSPSLKSSRRGSNVAVRGFVPFEATNEWGVGLEKANLITGQLAAAQLVSMTNFLRDVMRTTVPQVGVMTFEAARLTGITTAGIIDLAAPLLVGAMVNPLAGTLEAVRTTVTPRIEYAGWGEAMNPVEYEARLAALSPGLANNEAEEHVPPPPRGKIRAIPLG